LLILFVCNGEGIAIQMNKLNNILTCVVILLVLFVANGVVGNYLLSLSNDDDDSPDIESVIFREDHQLLTMFEKTQELPQLTLQTFDLPP
jgi:hypothetical protein